MIKSNKKQENLCLNFIKGLACMAVVQMHCSFPSPYGRVISYCLLFAVPVFFFTSGFFAYYEDATVACDKIKVKIKHIFKLTVISECIYFLFSLVTNFFDNNIQEFFVSTFSIKNILSAVFLNIPIFNGTLWFLYALLFSYIALYFVYKFNLFKICYFLSPIILILHVVIRPMLKSYEWYNAAYFRNFILYGFPLLIIGYWLRENKDKLGKIDFNNYYRNTLYFH